jgi:UDP-glucose 4-epimerase
MREFNVKNIIFSSSATVYGTPEYLPIDEKHPVGQCTNPYGRTKYFIEQLLTDLSASDEVQSGCSL